MDVDLLPQGPFWFFKEVMLKESYFIRGISLRYTPHDTITYSVGIYYLDRLYNVRPFSLDLNLILR